MEKYVSQTKYQHVYIPLQQIVNKFDSSPVDCQVWSSLKQFSV